MIIQNMKYRIVLTKTSFILVHLGQVNINFCLVQNEMGPGWTSRAWFSTSLNKSPDGFDHCHVVLTLVMLNIFIYYTPR